MTSSSAFSITTFPHLANRIKLPEGGSDPMLLAVSPDSRLFAVLDEGMNISVYPLPILWAPAPNDGGDDDAPPPKNDILPVCVVARGVATRSTRGYWYGQVPITAAASMQFSPDSSHVSVCDGQGAAFVVNLATSRLVAAFRVAQQQQRHHGRGRTQQTASPPPDKQPMVTCSAWTHDGRHLLLARANGTISCHNVFDRSYDFENWLLQSIGSEITSLKTAVVKDEEFAVATTKNGVVAVFQLRTVPLSIKTFYFEPKVRLEATLLVKHQLQLGSSSYCSAVFVTASGQLNVAVGCDGHVAIIDPQGEKLILRRSLGVNSTVTHLEYVGSEGALFVVTSCGRARLFANPLRDNKAVAEQRPCEGARVAADGTVVRIARTNSYGGVYRIAFLKL